jgi:hypothetical protein
LQSLDKSGISFFILTYLGTASANRLALKITFVLNIIFSTMLWFGVLFASVEPRFDFGYWGNITKWFGVYLFFWHFELLYAFGALLRGF